MGAKSLEISRSHLKEPGHIVKYWVLIVRDKISILGHNFNNVPIQRSCQVQGLL